MSSVIRKILIFITILLLVLVATNLNAQTSPYYSIRYSDSIQKEPNSDFVYNNVTITNVYGKPMILFVAVNTPTGWNLLSDNQLTVELQAGETYEMPIAFSKTPQALASWVPAKITVQLKNEPTPSEYTFYIKAKTRVSYSSSVKINDIKLSAYQENVDLKLYIKNTGNIEQHYRLLLKNKFFELDNKLVTVPLGPGKDTNYVYTLKISKNDWKELKNEEIKILLVNDSNRSHVFSYTISKISNVSKQNNSRYATMPVTIEGGIMSTGGKLSYSGGISGTLKFNDNSNLNFQYHTKQYGDQSVLGQHDLLVLDYNYKNLQIGYSSLMNDARLFSATGQGLKITYRWNNNTSLSVYGIKHYNDLQQKNDGYGGALQYSIKNVKVRQDFAGNIDNIWHVNSYLLYNTVELIKTKRLALTIMGGTGFDHYLYKTYDGKNDVEGTSAGYTAVFTKSKFVISSCFSQFDDNYPGNFKGFTSHSHNISYSLEKGTILSLYYQSSFSKNLGLKDSIFNTVNSTIYNTESYGISAGWRLRKMNFTVGTGILSQIGVPNVPPHYQTVTFDYAYRVSNKVNIKLGTVYGSSNTIENKGSKTNNLEVFFQRADITVPYGGVQFYYAKLPDNSLLNTGGTPGIEQGKYFESMNFSTYLDLHFFNKALNTRFQYNIATSNKTSSNSVSAVVQYLNKRHDYSVIFSSYMPLNNTPGSEGASLTFRKSLDIPLVMNRKYYDLSIVLFNDFNNNGKVDSNEEYIKNVEIKINDYPMLTNEQGKVEYENISNGSYKLDFANVKGLKGYAPTNGAKQTIIVKGNTTVYIPFKRSNFVYGHINFDFTGRELFSLDNFKINATDSAGNVYSVFTDEAGEYYMNLPANKYIISLNRGAFDENFKPVQASYDVDLINNEEANVNFKVLQQKREVKMIPASLE